MQEKSHGLESMDCSCARKRSLNRWWSHRVWRHHQLQHMLHTCSIEMKCFSALSAFIGLERIRKMYRLCSSFLFGNLTPRMLMPISHVLTHLMNVHKLFNLFHYQSHVCYHNKLTHQSHNQMFSFEKNNISFHNQEWQGS